MPLRSLKAQTAEPAPGGLRHLDAAGAPAPTPDTTPDTESNISPLALAGGLAGTGLLAYLGLKNPGIAGRAAKFVNTIGQQSMLSGLAPLKSALGNIGAAIETSAETKSLEPLKQFLSMQTVRDALNTYRENPIPTGASKLPDWLPTPGRVMQSLDTATQGALRRAGLSGKDAERAVLQSPLDPKLAKALENPVAQYLIPFRRTPFNQFTEGFSTIGENPALSAAYAGVGAAHGAATSDEKYPVTLPLGVSLAARRGVSYGLGALAGRVLAGGKASTAGTASSLLPVSEYGITQGIEDPAARFTEPGALRALRTLSR